MKAWGYKRLVPIEEWKNFKSEIVERMSREFLRDAGFEHTQRTINFFAYNDEGQMVRTTQEHAEYVEIKLRGWGGR